MLTKLRDYIELVEMNICKCNGYCGKYHPIFRETKYILDTIIGRCIYAN